MATLSKKNFSNPDEKINPEKTDMRIVDLAGTKMARIEVQQTIEIIFEIFFIRFNRPFCRQTYCVNYNSKVVTLKKQLNKLLAI